MMFNLKNNQNIYITIKEHILGRGPEYDDGSIDSHFNKTIKERTKLYNRLEPYIKSGEKLKVLNIELANQQHRGFDSLQQTIVSCENPKNLYESFTFKIGTREDNSWDDVYSVEFEIR